jgi:hypothetical protein
MNDNDKIIFQRIPGIPMEELTVIQLNTKDFDEEKISHCFGCGLGKSIHYFLNFNFFESINHHWFGPISVFIILNRIYKLFIIKYRGV